jgi:hypothetical protein
MAEVVVFDIDAQSAIQKLAQLRADTNSLKEAQKQLAEEVKKGNKDAATSYEANAIILKNVANEQRVLSRAVEGYSAVQKSATDTTKFANNSIQQNRDLLKQLTATYIGLKNPTAAQTEQIRKLSDQLKEQESAIGNNVRNVGNYQGALKNATSEIKVFGVSLGSLQTTFNTYNSALKDGKAQLAGYITGQKAADGATKLSILSTGGLSAAMNVLRLALIATGIGAIVVAFGALVAAILSTQKGTDALNMAMTQIGAVFKATLGVAQELGFKLIEVFSSPKQAISDLIDFLQQNLVNRLNGFKVALDGILERDTKKLTDGILQIGTGITNLTDKAQDFANKTGKFLKDNLSIGEQIAKLNKEIQVTEIDLNKQRAIAQAKENELLLIARNTNLSAKERKAAVDEIIASTEKLTKIEEDLQNKKIKALQLEQSLNDTGDKQKQELADLEAELINIQQQGQRKKLELIRVLNSAEKQENKATKEELKKTEFDLVKFNEKVRTDELKKTLDNLKINTEQQELIVKEQYANGIINKQQYEAELQRIQLESFDTQIIALSDYGEQILEKEIERQNAILDLKIQANEKEKQLSQELIDQELINQQIIQDAKIEGVNGLIQIAQIAAGENQKLAKIFLVAEKAVAIAEIIINLQRQLAFNATTAAANPLNATTFGAAGAAQLAALNTLSKIRAGIGIATIAATTIKDVALPKKAEGGEISIDGKSHSQGGEVVTVGGRPVAEVEGGEGLYVMKKNAYQKIKQFSAINEAFGGKSWMNGSSKYLADGGAINTTLPILESRGRVNSTIEQNRILSQALRQLPAPVLSIKEFEKKQAIKDKSVRISEL